MTFIKCMSVSGELGPLALDLPTPSWQAHARGHKPEKASPGQRLESGATCRAVKRRRAGGEG
jgi:hypothetical protein